MRTFIVSALLIGSLFVAVPAVHALTTGDDIDAKVQALLAQIETLQKQLTALVEKKQTVLTNINDTVSTPVCYRVTRVLRAGVSGEDVLELQRRLKEKGFLAADATGYYGALTQDAVQKFQAAEGIVSSGNANTTGFGLVGPATRRILWKCDDASAGTMRFIASPSRGPAPLAVTFKTWISGFRAPGHTYVIDFGDGTAENATDCFAPADACLEPGTNMHTYTQDGSYTAILYHVIDPCAGQTACRAAVHREVAAKTQISVGAIACTKEYSPVCGAKPIVCITTPCDPIPTTYSNKCMMEADGSSFLYAGQCRAAVANPADDPQCQIWSDGCNTCSRGAPGGPGMCTLMACQVTDNYTPKPYCKSYFSDTDDKPPVISSFTGPTTLKVGEQGTWKIQANDPENGTLTYDITWGDENGNFSAPGVWNTAAQVTQSTTFTHSYLTEGTHTVTIIVRDQKGNTAKSAAIVKVGDTPVACTMQYDPVCGAKQVQCIKAPCNPIPTTYGNTCMMNADQASFLYTGECKPDTTVWNPESDPQCRSWSDGCNTCSRSTPGGPGMCTLMACMTTEGYTPPAPYCKEKFDTTTPTNRPPTISSFSGPTTLSVGQLGTWTIKATDPEGGILSYDITWGDESLYAAAMSFGGMSSFTQSSSFSHTYMSSGVRTVKVTVYDNKSASASASATVQVGSGGTSMCTMEYAPVCGRPMGCMNTCPVGMYCAAVCQMYPVQTYSNRCMLTAAGAEFVASGECPASGLGVSVPSSSLVY